MSLSAKSWAVIRISGKPSSEIDGMPYRVSVELSKASQSGKSEAVYCMVPL